MKTRNDVLVLDVTSRWAFLLLSTIVRIISTETFSIDGSFIICIIIIMYSYYINNNIILLYTYKHVRVVGRSSLKHNVPDTSNNSNNPIVPVSSRQFHILLQKPKWFCVHYIFDIIRIQLTINVRHTSIWFCNSVISHTLYELL